MVNSKKTLVVLKEVTGFEIRYIFIGTSIASACNAPAHRTLEILSFFFYDAALTIEQYLLTVYSRYKPY